MLINLPEDWEDVEKAYNQIEMYCGSRGGQYPIGKDNWWHSGVHIHGGKPIKPLIKGKIIACRLADKFACIPRIKKFDDVEYSKLNDLERPLYAEDKNMYTLQHEGINQQALDELEKKHKGIKSWFEKSG